MTARIQEYTDLSSETTYVPLKSFLYEEGETDNEGIRRTRIKTDIRYDEFVSLLKKLHNIGNDREITKITYKDPEGDNIIIGSTDEISTAISISGFNKGLFIKVTVSNATKKEPTEDDHNLEYSVIAIRFKSWEIPFRMTSPHVFPRSATVKSVIDKGLDLLGLERPEEGECYILAGFIVLFASSPTTHISHEEKRLCDITALEWDKENPTITFKGFPKKKADVTTEKENSYGTVQIRFKDLDRNRIGNFHCFSGDAVIKQVIDTGLLSLGLERPKNGEQAEFTIGIYNESLPTRNLSFSLEEKRIYEIWIPALETVTFQGCPAIKTDSQDVSQLPEKKQDDESDKVKPIESSDEKKDVFSPIEKVTDSPIGEEESKIPTVGEGLLNVSKTEVSPLPLVETESKEERKTDNNEETATVKQPIQRKRVETFTSVNGRKKMVDTTPDVELYGLSWLKPGARFQSNQLGKGTILGKCITNESHLWVTLDSEKRGKGLSDLTYPASFCEIKTTQDAIDTFSPLEEVIVKQRTPYEKREEEMTSEIAHLEKSISCVGLVGTFLEVFREKFIQLEQYKKRIVDIFVEMGFDKTIVSNLDPIRNLRPEILMEKVTEDVLQILLS